MALTLEDYQKLDTDFIVKGLYYHIRRADQGFLSRLAVRPFAGNGMKYNVKTSRAAISDILYNEDVPESSGDFEQRSAAIYVIAHDSLLYDVPKELNSTQDPWVVQLESDMDDFMHAVCTRMIRGQTSTLGNAKQAKGLLKLIAELESEATTDLDGVNNSQVIANSATSGALTLGKLDELIDAVDGCNALLMNKKTRRKVNALARASGSVLTETHNDFGEFITNYNGIPIHLDENIPDNMDDNSSSVNAIATWDASQVSSSGHDNSPIFALRVGDENGFCIMQAIPFTLEPPFRHQKKLADVRRKKWFMGFGLFDKYAAAVLTGMNPGD